MTSDLILSQNAIDVLLAEIPKESPAAHVSPSPPSAPASTETTAPKQVGGIEQAVVTLSDVIEIAGKAAEAETAPVQDSISRIYKRIGELETKVARIPQLEAEIADLKRTAQSKVSK